MPTIELITEINAPLSVVFDLSRNVDIHVESMAHTRERIVAGTKSGLMGLDDWVTWEAYHLGFKWSLTSLITEFESPTYFKDEMVQGPFERMEHEHHFSHQNGLTTMRDVFYYEAPFGIIGKLGDSLFLKRYMERLLMRRNEVVRLKANTIK